MAIGCGVLGNGISGLFRPVCERLARMFKDFCIFRIPRQVRKLIWIFAYLEQFFLWAGVGKYLLLLSRRFSGSMGFP